MRIVSERVGDKVVVTIEDCRTVVLMLPVDVALKLGTTLLAQAAVCDSELTVPEEWSKP